MKNISYDLSVEHLPLLWVKLHEIVISSVQTQSSRKENGMQM